LSDLSRPFGATPNPSDTGIGGRAAAGPFVWPSPPYAAYPDGLALTRPMLCDVVGLNGTMTSGRLLNFVPEESAIHVHMPPARTPIVLKFTQFQSLRVLEPIKPRMIEPFDPRADLLADHPRSPYVLTLRDGHELHGETIGHEEMPYGVFLFPPLDAIGHVTRLFVPKATYSDFAFGSKLGELLVESSVTTRDQIDAAFHEQQRLRKRKLGDILLTKQVVTPEQLMEALEQQRNMPLVRVGDALQQLGMVTAEQVREAVQEQAQDRNVPLGEILIRMGAVSREDVQVALARKMGYPVVDIAKFPIEPDAVRKVPVAVAQRLQCIPLMVRDGRLVVALNDPARRRTAVDEIEFVSQSKVLPVLAITESIDDELRRVYGSGTVADAGGTENAALAGAELDADKVRLLESLEKDVVADQATEDRPIEQSDNSLVKLINTLILEAHGQKVSDIHIEASPGKEKIKIRFRQDGVLRTHLELPHTYRNALVARIKIMCDLDIAERRKPQDGKINFSRFAAGHKIELRVATIPTHSGCEDVVMRILASAKPIPLDKLGLSPYNSKHLKLAMERPYGMVLCVGPTGSGKTTTLHSAMSFINTPDRKIWTAEDPIEITQQGLRQVQVNAKIDWTFARALRAFLRADPDVVMVGEIRDRETAQMAVEASLTGHLVLSTLHTNSAPETVTRLLDMGMDPFNFADSLLAVLAQRLVRRICPSCRAGRPATHEEVDELLDDYLQAAPKNDPAFDRGGVLRSWLERFGTDGRLMRWHSPGCDACAKSGFKGRAGLHELMVMDKDLRRLVQTGKRAEDIQQQAMTTGMRTLRQDGIEKVLMGLCSIEEVRSISNT
jgi:type II secretory ATPase GspE/PulE/Tfp pilus assembly ATPase PilB-like protein